MENKNSSNDFQPPSNYDELFMQRSLIFTDSLKDLRNIRNQLYSAAEYFELSYHRNDQDPILLESLKDYVAKALISTVDHLGSVAYKVNNFLDENVNEVSETKLQVSCIEQRLRACQEYTDRSGLSQQSLVIETPKYHKQYIVPDGCFSEAVEAIKEKPHPSILRKGQSGQASTEFSTSPGTFSFTKAATSKGLAKRSTSPLHFPIRRSGSVVSQPTSPSFPVKRSGSVVQRSISPNSFINRQRYPPEPRRSHSLYSERDGTKDIEVYAKKTRNLFKALLSMHKSKNDSGLYR